LPARSQNQGRADAEAAFRKTDIPTRPIVEMENGKRPIGKAMAKRLGEALGVGYKVFL
jgi:plasmid maintenance system antidote protein VapI